MSFTVGMSSMLTGNATRVIVKQKQLINTNVSKKNCPLRQPPKARNCNRETEDDKEDEE